ncbi:ParA family protein [Borreliella burgdorferi]
MIALTSVKGGARESTPAILFSYLLKELGKKILLIDLDSQNSLTSYFAK